MRYIIAVVVLLNQFACSTRDNLDSFSVVDTKEYNDRIALATSTGEHWANDPILITRELFRSDGYERKIIIDFESSAAHKATITLTQEDLNDDSVDGEKRIIEFEKVNSTWSIKEIRVGVKCWESRGHADYSGEPCS